jgi:phosphoribosylformylglycinamidine cyclo-ligase
MAITYQQAGVDIEAGDALVERIKPHARRTWIPEVVQGVGGFASLCAMPSDIEQPLLVSGTDGVGTKLKLAFATGRHGTIGQDLVAMCVNDVVTVGARPLFFLDYFGCGKLDVGTAESVVAGIADGCQLAGCALLGGETAELPGMYPEGEYDLAGFAVGVVDRRRVLGAARVKPGDALIGVRSSGLHSNGYSLARRVIEKEMRLSLDATPAGFERTLADVLLEPTRIYARAVRALAAALGEDLHALSHITGGGIVGNLPRVLPEGVTAHVRLPELYPIFDLIQRGGPVDPAEMARTFNLGVGLVLVVEEEAVSRALDALSGAGEQASLLGALKATPGAPASVVLD